MCLSRTSANRNSSLWRTAPRRPRRSSAHCPPLPLPLSSPARKGIVRRVLRRTVSSPRYLSPMSFKYGVTPARRHGKLVDLDWSVGRAGCQWTKNQLIIACKFLFIKCITLFLPFRVSKLILNLSKYIFQCTECSSKVTDKPLTFLTLNQ